LCHAAVDRQAMAVLHEGAAQVAELGRLAIALLVEPGLGIGRAPVGLVVALLFVEAALGVAPRPIRVVVAAVRRKLFSEAQASISLPSTEKWSDEISLNNQANGTLRARPVTLSVPVYRWLLWNRSLEEHL
jgi:hypothetical protein